MSLKWDAADRWKTGTMLTLTEVINRAWDRILDPVGWNVLCHYNKFLTTNVSCFVWIGVKAVNETLVRTNTLWKGCFQVWFWCENKAYKPQDFMIVDMVVAKIQKLNN